MKFDRFLFSSTLKNVNTSRSVFKNALFELHVKMNGRQIKISRLK